MLALAPGRAAAVARTPAGLPAGIRLGGPTGPGVIAGTVPPGEARRVLAGTGRAGERERDPPARVVVHHAIAPAPRTTSGTREVPRRLPEGPRRLRGAEAVRVAGESG